MVSIYQQHQQIFVKTGFDFWPVFHAMSLYKYKYTKRCLSEFLLAIIFDLLKNRSLGKKQKTIFVQKKLKVLHTSFVFSLSLLLKHRWIKSVLTALFGACANESWRCFKFNKHYKNETKTINIKYVKAQNWSNT